MTKKTEAETSAPKAPAAPAGLMALKVWAKAYQVELTLFAIVFVTFTMFSGQRFLRQSAAPHFVYQAKAFLEGHLSLEYDVLPLNRNGAPEDWACVHQENGEKRSCKVPYQQGDTFYSSFPAFPSVVMMPFVLVNGYQLNDTSFGVIIGALAVALFYGLLRLISEQEDVPHTKLENAAVALMLGFGTVFFYAAIRGEVWFSAEVMGVGFTALYLRNSVRARNPLLAGLFWSMAVLTRTPLFFTGLFFFLEAASPTRSERVKELKAFFSAPGAKLDPIKRFVMGAAPLGVLAAVMNLSRFGKLTEFGHAFLYFNRVNDDIAKYGLFHPVYLPRNLDAAFLRLPSVSDGRLFFDPWGMSLFLTLPLLAVAFVPSTKPQRVLTAVAAMGAVLVTSWLFPAIRGPGTFAGGDRAASATVVTLAVLSLFAWYAKQWSDEPTAPRLLVPTLLTLVACAVPGLLYQNTGYAQFGFRFSIDYTPYVLLLVALGGWSFKRPLVMALAGLGVLVNFWGAVAFRGFTEGERGWM